MPGLPRIKMPQPGRVYIPRPHGPRVRAKFRFRFINKGHRIADYVTQMGKAFLYRSGGSLRKYMITRMKSKRNKDVHSRPGQAPFLHPGQGKKSGKAFARAAIQFAVDLTRRFVIVGVRRSVAGFWGQKHEHGGWFGRRPPSNRKASYPPRPFARPSFHRWQKYGMPVIMRDVMKRTYRI